MRRYDRRASRVPLTQGGGRLLAWGVFLLIVACAIANVVRYLTETNAVDIAVVAAAGLSLFAMIFAPPQRVTDVAIPIGLFLGGVMLSLRHEWAGTPIPLIAQRTVVIFVCIGFFFAGVSLRQRMPVAWMNRLLYVCLGSWLLMFLTAVFSPLRFTHNSLSGTMFETVAIGLSAHWAMTGRLNEKVAGAAAVMISVGAFILDHRTMMALGVGFGGAVAFQRFYRPSWLRLAMPLVGLAVSIGVVVALTTMQNTQQMAEINAQVTETTGRTMDSGRDTLWGPIVQAIIDGPMVGYGPTKEAADVTGLGFSTHNSFLAIGLNFGVIGVCLIVLTFLALIRRAVTATVTSAGALLAAYLMVMIVHNSSENALVMNNVPISILTWLNLGFLATSCFMPRAETDADKVLLLSPR